MDNQIAAVEKTSNTLTSIERSNLTELEETILKHLNAFYYEVGFALMQIRDNKLYRETYSTFELYCKEKWQISRPRAYELMKAAEVKDNLSATADISERALRPITRIKDPDEQREVYQKAVETAAEGKVTTRHVEATINDLRHKEIQPASDAMACADSAINQLENITQDDPLRSDAIKKVAKWCNDNLQEVQEVNYDPKP